MKFTTTSSRAAESNRYCFGPKIKFGLLLGQRLKCVVVLGGVDGWRSFLIRCYDFGDVIGKFVGSSVERECGDTAR